MLYLFIIALLTLAIIKLQKSFFPKFSAQKLSYTALVLLFIPAWLMQYLLNFAGKSLGQFIFMYLAGYYLFTQEQVLQKIKGFCPVSLALWLFSGGLYTFMYCFWGFRGVLCTVLYSFFGWTGILALLGMGHKLLNLSSKATRYFSACAYPVYIIHLPVLVAVGHYVLLLNIGTAMQFTLIALISFIITIAIYEAVKRIPLIRALLGISKQGA